VAGAMQALIYAFTRVLAFLLGGLLLGLLLGQITVGLLIALSCGLGWQLVNLYGLDGWLRARNRRAPPDLSGLWGEVVTNVVRLHRRKRYHKQRLLDVFRELRHSTAAMPDGVVVLNDNYEILWFNRMATRLLNLRRKVDVGLRITNLVRDPRFTRYLAAGDFHAPLEVAHATRDGVSLSFQLVPYGRQQRLMLVRDVSRQVALESMRKDFVANASHELRSPLTVITGYLETLVLDPQMDPALLGPLDEMRRQSDRMNQIVRDLLELSRLDAATNEAEFNPVDVPGLLRALCGDMALRPNTATVQLQLQSDADLLGTETELHSVLANLLDNAAKYTPAEGSVTVSWSVDAEGDAQLCVADTGPGIAAEHLPRLTERFYRVDAGRARSAGGTGLGLAIVKHALEHHGGRLLIESQEGVGSRFICHFPASRVLPDSLEGSIDTTTPAVAAGT